MDDRFVVVYKGLKIRSDMFVSQDDIRALNGMGTNLVCENCGGYIYTMCFKGTNHCSENCRKDLEKTA